MTQLERTGKETVRGAKGSGPSAISRFQQCVQAKITKTLTIEKGDAEAAEPGGLIHSAKVIRLQTHWVSADSIDVSHVSRSHRAAVANIGNCIPLRMISVMPKKSGNSAGDVSNRFDG